MFLMNNALKSWSWLVARGISGPEIRNLYCNYAHQQIIYISDIVLLSYLCAAMNTISLEQRANRAVSNWIFLGVIMLLVQVVLGGVTRLTGSGLSITEWDVVTGSLPPLNEAQWLEKFSKYQQTPQYRLLNTDFTLSDFKFIFFWEWFHRL